MTAPTFTCDRCGIEEAGQDKTFQPPWEWQSILDGMLCPECCGIMRQAAGRLRDLENDRVDSLRADHRKLLRRVEEVEHRLDADVRPDSRNSQSATNESQSSSKLDGEGAGVEASASGADSQSPDRTYHGMSERTIRALAEGESDGTWGDLVLIDACRAKAEAWDRDPDLVPVELADTGIMERLDWWADHDRRPNECAEDLREAAVLMKRWRNLAMYYRNVNQNIVLETNWGEA